MHIEKVLVICLVMGLAHNILLKMENMKTIRRTRKHEQNAIAQCQIQQQNNITVVTTRTALPIYCCFHHNSTQNCTCGQTNIMQQTQSKLFYHHKQSKQCPELIISRRESYLRQSFTQSLVRCYHATNEPGDACLQYAQNTNILGHAICPRMGLACT